MLPIQRKEFILKRLSDNRSDSIANLSSLLNVSEMTVRRDLRRMFFF
ncbi:DeoR family transcriptional regulator [Neobacillus jeddahensis]